MENTPATAPLLLVKPPLLLLVCAEAVCAGGSVGVTVSIETAPETVMVVGTGVGDHVDVGACSSEVVVDDVMSGTTGTIGVVEVLRVVGVGVEGRMEDTASAVAAA